MYVPYNRLAPMKVPFKTRCLLLRLERSDGMKHTQGERIAILESKVDELTNQIKVLFERQEILAENQVMGKKEVDKLKEANVKPKYFG